VQAALYGPCSQVRSYGLTVRHAALAFFSARIPAIVKVVPLFLPISFHHRWFLCSVWTTTGRSPKTYVRGSVFDPCSLGPDRTPALPILSERIFAIVQIVPYVLPHRFPPSFLPFFGLDHHRAFPPKTYVWGSVFDPCSQARS
jgi:hypothetical protein